MSGRPMSQRDHPGEKNRTPYGSGTAEDRKAFYLACLEFDALPGSRVNASRRVENVSEGRPTVDLQALTA